MLADAEIEELFTLMSADPWFGGVETGLRRTILGRCDRQRLGEGEFLFRKGDASTGLVGLVSGLLKASMLAENGKEGVLVLLEPGTWFGEASAIDKLERAHDVVALAPTEIVFIGNPEFDDLMQFPGFVHAISRLQARHIRIMYAMLEDAALRSTRARVVRRLRRLARGDTSPALADREVISITHELLAMMLGITRQTLALELKEIEATGAISMSYRRITITSLEKLKAMES